MPQTEWCDPGAVMVLKFAALCLCFCAAPLLAQENVITTIAGTDWLFPGNGQPALNAPLTAGDGLGLAVDSGGNYYIADMGNLMAMEVGRNAILNVIAGNGVNFVSGDGGPGVNASLLLPTTLAVDSAGNVYISEFYGRIRKLTTDGIINTIAGTGIEGYSGDGGPATQAELNQPYGVAVDSAGNVYISDTSNNRVRKVTPSGIITTVAGNGTQGNSGDNVPATSVPLNMPSRITVDAAGNLYIIEFGSPDGTQYIRVRKVDAKGIISTVAGGGATVGSPIATRAAIEPLAVAVDSSGNLYLVDGFNEAILKVDTSGRLTFLAGGSGQTGYAGDGGPPLEALFNFSAFPDIAVDSSGNIFIADDGNGRIRELTTSNTLQTVAGNGLFRFSGNGGPATAATLDYPVGVIGDSLGNIYVSEDLTSRVRRIAPDGTISVYAGGGGLGDSGDNGPAASAKLYYPSYMTFAPNGSLLIAEISGCVIRSIDPSGIIHTLAGTTACTYGGDGGPAIEASFNGPEGMAYDPSGNLWIADTYNNRMRVIAPNGIISTAAGNGNANYSGDNGPAINAELNEPVAVRVHNGGVYFSDYNNQRIRRIDLTTGIITTVAGNGQPAYSGDHGPATQASISYPQGITFDSAGVLYITDTGNRVVRTVDTTGIIRTFAGSSSKVPGDGGLATAAGFGSPQDVWQALSGDILITDAVLNRVRAVIPNLPSFQVSTANLAFTATVGAPAVDQTVNVTGSIPGLAFSVVPTASSPWLQVSPQSSTMPASLDINVNPSSLSAGSYQGTVLINAPYANPSQQLVQVALTVTAAGQPSLNVAPLSLTFSFVQGSAAATRAVTVSNAGGGSLTFSATSSSAWLSATPVSATLAAFGKVPVSIMADPTGLAPGVYSGTIAFSSADPAQNFIVPVTMTVTAVLQTILIPQNGLTFYAVQGGGALLPQFFNILNTGVGQMQFTTAASTLSGGSSLAPTWISSVFPGSGTSDASSLEVPPQVRVDVTPGNLTAGVYYGTIQVTAPGADNNPQSVSVILNVLPPGSTLGPLVQPAGLIYTAVAGGESPGSQTISIQSTNSNPVNFTSGFATADIQSWLTLLPTNGTISPLQPANIVLAPQISGLSPGVHRGTVTLSFSDGSTRTVSIVLVIVPAGTSLPATSLPASGTQGRAQVQAQAQTTCVATTLAPVFTLLSSGFTISAGFPGQVAVDVVDDCGNNMTSGGVTVSFSNGDPPQRLSSLNNGNWAGTWTPQHTVSPITVTANAAVPAQSLTGQAQISGLLNGSATLTIGTGGILNGASFAPQAPLAPGSFVTIFGNQLAQGSNNAKSVPLPTNLGGSTVFLAGQQAPLLYTSSGQVNAIVPYGLAVNTTQQVVISSGTIISVPQPVTLSAAAPGVFTRDGSGQGQGIIIGVDSSGVQTYADSSNPVQAGEAIVIYCTGLGEVSPTVTAGTPAPLTSVSRTVNPVTVTIGGVPAIVAFAGLTPGSTGLYQVNATVPAGVAPGSQVPVVLSAAGQQSQPVTIAVQ
jgi:uncharacterized protein (TIGR03437 family)